MNQDINLERFLINIRSKTLAFAVFRLKDEEAALDILQEVMMSFTASVHQYEEEAWTNLFYKILTRRITDWHRKQIWRRKLHHILPFSHVAGTDEEQGNAYTYEDNTQSNPVQSQQGVDELSEQFESALQTLPTRQQEAYLLRQWQGMSTKETAQIMQCSEGSVKTHFFRAMQSLKKQLGEWIDEG